LFRRDPLVNRKDRKHGASAPLPAAALLWSARVDGLTRTAMLKLASRPVYHDITVRNANTTRKVLELMRAMRT
jgi:uncharacterized protein (DUF1697 family)